MPRLTTTVGMKIELESTDIEINLVSPAFTNMYLKGCAVTSRTRTAREDVRVARSGRSDGLVHPWENDTIPG